MMSEHVHVGLADVARYFETIEDPRSHINRKHPLPSVLVIAIMAVLAGADGPTRIARWALRRKKLLQASLPLPNGVPCKDVFQRVLSALAPQTFQACFALWLQSLRQAAQTASEIDAPVLSIDGKTDRRTHDRSNGLGPLHCVSVWAGEYGLSLGQVACADKSNEITAIPEVLRLIDIKGAIITIDAMGAQKKIAGQIVAGGADYVFSLKGNQGKIHKATVDHIQGLLEGDFEKAPYRCHRTEETGHGRTETRTYVQTPAPKSLPGFAFWKGLMTIGAVISECVRNGKECVEIRYFLSSLPMGVKEFARAVRTHWSIENSCHWTLDVVYRQDQSRIRDKHARENFAWLNRFTLSLLKQSQGKDSIAMKRSDCAWDDDVLMQVLTGQKI